MWEKPSARILPDGRRLLLQQGPIDLVIEAVGEQSAVKAAHEAAILRFDGLLAELCDELKLLRTAVSRTSPLPLGPVARRMHAAVAPFAETGFITPMAAVAASVAQEILGVMCQAAPLSRAYVNNGGDIALYLASGEQFRIGLVKRPDRPEFFATATIRPEDGVAGIATSGYPGRSFSLGIAEAVTVLAPTAAMADAAATVIANAIDLPGHAAVERQPASSIQSDSDLGERLVTRHVGPLATGEIETALAAGVAEAERLRATGLIVSAAMHLQGVSRTLPTPMIVQEDPERRLARA
ncbi:conserved hypothetical protein [Bosea sp. 62]|uniref:UPF0280 family protein n=1 Tax=unclassified Bosea (in: a-proteobacteria) TaxID=2653178 RepID=UPI001255CAA5|nr:MULTISPECIES: UPF0280 family protein [unclassified Bosea (in: a-proteobacteria)]CAD5286367.1 conserved hypothetical protein [Bosea sp. 21B]CAD5288949.1 conserved hypothetical protein [Bosea sp. 46]CAD5301288.1 conserved hypothetical protein [Bosea sp. 7B]VVT60572.1 Thiamine biosynthesis protein ApbE [Bosea sp. EC-HK365B]VXB05190.1 conserved hypothetical protein [Bosea sp. 62]